MSQVLRLTRLSVAVAACCTVVPNVVLAQSAPSDFQNLLFNACLAPIGELAVRCNESFNGEVDGDLSGDSERSLAPTQTLGQAATALSDARTRVRAVVEREQTPQHPAVAATETTREQTDAFGISGLSMFAQAQRSELSRVQGAAERGYDNTVNGIQIGLDYRLSDDVVVGVVGTADQSDTEFLSYLPTGAFPDFNLNDSGTNASDSFGLSLFGTWFIDDSLYLEGIASYIRSDYTFRRNAVFQNSSRTIDALVRTKGETEGTQLALGLGLGYDLYAGSTTVGLYGRLDYLQSKVDSYTETGGSGFALNVDRVDTDETRVTVGARVSEAISTGGGVIMPNAFIEYEHIASGDTPSANVSLALDPSGRTQGLEGDKLDRDLVRAGIGLSTVFPNGFSGFVAISKEFGRQDIDQTLINAGIRVEF